MILYRPDVEAWKSQVRFSTGCNQPAGVPLEAASLPRSAGRRQNALLDYETDEENTKDHRS